LSPDTNLGRAQGIDFGSYLNSIPRQLVSLSLSSRRRNAAAALLLALSATACLSGTDPNVGTPSNPATETYAASLGVNVAQMTKLSNDLYYQDLTVGTGTQVTPGKQLTVNYTGWLTNGFQFDTSIGKTPFTFTLQGAQVIAGWDLGIVGMHAGGKRRLVIGSNLGYGPGGFGTIPGNATLVFDVTVVSTQ
jgi:FKBP-type peptidyl-prolyl cis-trans isomerase FkpA